MIKSKYIFKELNSYYNSIGCNNYRFIKNGNGSDTDAGIKHFSTRGTWEKYTAGKISRDDAIKRAFDRMVRMNEKKQDAAINKLETIDNASAPTFIEIVIEWRKSSMYGYNPYATITTDVGSGHGRASGCGYDKKSAAVATALNQIPGAVKILVDLKTAAIKNGATDKSATACTGICNSDVCGYGSGYGPIPYYESGVGYECFDSIFLKAGYKRIACYDRKHTDIYVYEKRGNKNA